MKNIEVSSAFKHQTIKAILAIILFILSYLLMFVFAVLLTVILVYIGIALISFSPSFITIILGLGLASLGFLVMFFLLKFIFNSNQVDLSHLIEIKKTDEPKLFLLIEEIVNEVGTKFPKKIYISAEVNAAVFYDSSFWSMFFPVKKNLQIGLGLVNTVTKSELKAILSHEFGHFSQKTMKVGSYVYNVNKVIFNLLFDNESYNNLMREWSNAHSFFAIFVYIANQIIDLVKYILKQIYDLVNKSYLALSREMEFQADEIAANITGFEPLKSSLLRLSLSEYAYNIVLSFYENKIAENQKTENIFKDHFFVTNFLAKENNIEIKNNLPQISIKDLNKFNKSKLILKDQWASHPSTEDRVTMLEKTALNASKYDNDSANNLFADIEQIQKKLTDIVFKEVAYTKEYSTLSESAFKIEFKEEFLKNSFPKIYNSYYDDKNPLTFDFQHIIEEDTIINLEDLYSESMVENVYVAIYLQSDIDVIKQIYDRTIDVKSFDYDGIKYSKNESENLIKKLEVELENVNVKIKNNDINIYKYFKSIEQETKFDGELEKLYNQLFVFEKDTEPQYEIFFQLTNALQFINTELPFDEIRANFLKMELLEEKFKNEIKSMLEDSKYENDITKRVKTIFDLYLSKKWPYFGNEKYFDKNLEILFSALNTYNFLLSRGYFYIKQKLLNYQLELNEMKNKNR